MTSEPGSDSPQDGRRALFLPRCGADEAPAALGACNRMHGPGTRLRSESRRPPPLRRRGEPKARHGPCAGPGAAHSQATRPRPAEARLADSERTYRAAFNKFKLT